MSEVFETQIIGRIRRMPKAKHYENELMDNCFLYTFDTKYTEIVKDELGDNASECKLIYLKSEYKGFKLIKEYRIMKQMNTEVEKRLKVYIII